MMPLTELPSKSPFHQLLTPPVTGLGKLEHPDYRRGSPSGDFHFNHMENISLFLMPRKEFSYSLKMINTILQNSKQQIYPGIVSIPIAKCRAGWKEMMFPGKR